ncbi:sensor histidine kinase [Sphingomonas sp. SCN 67-18]|uniref:sensor histidine kinase n=1 Tax=uncultured Sphingomonas sp. TaxID=158754 RepID=UPI0025CD7FF8|nr:PAS domain S-box protein [Sphingomonas sp. SCN 67-18]
MADLRRQVKAVEGEVAGLHARLGISEADYRALFEHAGVGVAHVGLSGEFIDLNSHFCEYLGYAREELLGATFLKVTHPEDADPNLGLFNGQKWGAGGGYRMEKRYVRSNGEIVWADLSVSVLRDADGNPQRFVSIITDISEPKKNEERLKFFLGEMGHRAKNLLSVIQATSRQIARTTKSVPEFLDAFDNRLAGIAAAQNALIRHDYIEVDLAELIESQIAVFVTPGDPRIHVDGPAVLLSPNAARVIGLALHELATNACKYGALSSGNGNIAIEWTVTDEQFAMSWTEQDGPPVTPPTRVGFGRTVMERMVAASLHGAVELRFPADGLVWRLQAPLRSLAS